MSKVKIELEKGSHVKLKSEEKSKSKRQNAISDSKVPSGENKVRQPASKEGL